MITLLLISFSFTSQAPTESTTGHDAGEPSRKRPAPEQETEAGEEDNDPPGSPAPAAVPSTSGAPQLKRKRKSLDDPVVTLMRKVSKTLLDLLQRIDNYEKS